MARAISVRMSNIRKEINSQVGSLCCREDFDYLFYSYEMAKNKGEKVRLLNEVEKMVGALIDESCCCNTMEEYKRIVDSSPVVLSKEDLIKKMLELISEKITEFPDSVEFITRTVNDLGDPEFANDTLRVRILKQFKKHLNIPQIDKHYKNAYYSKTLDSYDMEKIDDSIFQNLDNCVTAVKDLSLLCDFYGDYVVFNSEELDNLRVSLGDDLSKKLEELNNDVIALFRMEIERKDEIVNSNEYFEKLRDWFEYVIERNIMDLNKIMPHYTELTGRLTKYKKKKTVFSKKSYFIDNVLNKDLLLLSDDMKSKICSPVQESDAIKDIYNIIYSYMRKNDCSLDDLELISMNSSDDTDSYRACIKNYIKRIDRIIYSLDESEKAKVYDIILKSPDYSKFMDTILLELLINYIEESKETKNGLLRIVCNVLSDGVEIEYPPKAEKNVELKFKHIAKTIDFPKTYKLSDNQRSIIEKIFPEIDSQYTEKKIYDYICAFSNVSLLNSVVNLLSGETDTSSLLKGKKITIAKVKTLVNEILKSNHKLSEKTKAEIVEVIKSDDDTFYGLLSKIILYEDKIIEEKTSDECDIILEKMEEEISKLEAKVVLLEKYVHIKVNYKMARINSTHLEAKFIEWLKWSDCLSKGKFGTNLSIKKPLYFFAFAFDMKYYPDKESDDYDETRDIVKNLFDEYYCDNLMRYLTLYSTDKAEAEPTGAGINYRNFAEAINIYYLNKGDLKREHRFIKAQCLIGKIKKEEKGKLRNFDLDLETRDYRTNLIDIVLKTAEVSLEETIKKNYKCDSRVNEDLVVGEFQLELSKERAFYEYEVLIECIQKSLKYNKGSSWSEYLKDVYVKSADFDFLSNEFLKEEIHYEMDSKLMLIWKNVINKLKPSSVLCVIDKDKITRTKLIASYYHYYCICMAPEDGSWVSFTQVRDDFINELDDLLEESGFQKISFKNIFDVLVILLTFCKINNIDEM